MIYFDNIVIGGAMANTFLLAKGYNVGKSLVENKLVNVAKEILFKAKNFNCNLILPIDVVCSNNFIDSYNIRFKSVPNCVTTISIEVISLFLIYSIPCFHYFSISLGFPSTRYWYAPR